jgi:hypothetical protein
MQMESPSESLIKFATPVLQALREADSHVFISDFLTRCMEQSPYWKAYSRTQCQEIKAVYGPRRFVIAISRTR